MPNTLVPRIPSPLVTGYNIAAPGANTNILDASLTPKRAGWFHGSIVLNTSSVVNYTVSDGTTTFTVGLDESSTIPAGDAYQFGFAVHPNFSYNFQVETNGIIRQIVVFESDDPPGLPANLGTVTVGDVTVTSLTPGTGAANLGKAEDAVAASGDVGVMALAVQRSTPASDAADGDYVPLHTDAAGRLNAAANLEIAGAAAPGGAGAVSASTPRMTLASDDPAVVALQVIDDWDETDRAKVNPIVGQAGVTGGSGVVGAATQRVVLATDVALPAGGNNIGDVDVLTVPAPLSTSGGGVEATALRVTVANDSTGVLSVDDNAGSLTVDNAALAVVGGGAEATALRVTVANDSTGVVSVDDNAGSLTVDVGTALPAGANNIGDVDVLSVIPGTGATNLGKATDDAAGATDTGIVPLAIRDDSLSALVPAEGDYVPLRVANSGALHVVQNGALTANLGTIGTGATNLGKAEDAAHTSGDVGVEMLAVRQDTAAALAGTDGDYAPLEVDANGRLHVIEPSAAAATTALQVIDDWDETDRAKVNVIVGQAGITAGAGAVAASTPRVTMASDDPAVVALQIIDDWDSTDHAKVVGAGDSITAAYTRPADTTAYTAGDALSDSTSAPTNLTFTSAFRISDGTAFLISASAVRSVTAGTQPDLELWLFHTAPAATNDNAAWAPSDAELLNVVAVVEFSPSSWKVGSGNSWAHGALRPDKPLLKGVASANLVGVVVVRNAYTPSSAEVLTIRLAFAQN